MNIITRPLAPEDQAQALWVEAGAMPNNQYLAEVWDYFTLETDGNLLGAFVDDILIGIAKITRLYENYGWLETLRVHPDWQRQGVGNALWQQYFREMKNMQLQTVGMYTESYNIASKTLAENFGLRVQNFYTEFLRPVSTRSKHSFDFTTVDGAQGEVLLSPHYQHMPPYLVINRTFFPVKEGLGSYLASQGWLYSDNAGNLVIAGNRFHPKRLLHIPYFFGDAAKALLFAEQLAQQQSAPSLSCLYPSEGEHIARLKTLGFEPADNFMTLWIDL